MCALQERVCIVMFFSLHVGKYAQYEDNSLDCMESNMKMKRANSWQTNRDTQFC